MFELEENHYGHFVYFRSFAFNGDCAFNGNKKGNIAIVDQKNMTSLQHSEFLEDNYDESGFKNAAVSITNAKLLNGQSSPILIDDNEESSSSSHTSNNKSYQADTIAEISIITID